MKRWLLILLILVALPVSSRAAEPHLTKRRVARLADLAAKHAGYDLHRFHRPDLSFSSTAYGRFWVAVYIGKPDEQGSSILGNNFSVRVEDKDGRTSVSGGR